MNDSNSKVFRIYVSVCLFLIVVLLASLVGSIAFVGIKLKDETAVVNSKVNSFSQNVNNVNKNLQDINTQLQKQNSTLSTLRIPVL